jgi:tellurite resistance protein TehA-like permease
MPGRKEVAPTPLQPYKFILTLPLVVGLAGAGALMMNPAAPADLFAGFWWAMTAAVTAFFLALMRWGFDVEGEDDEPEAVQRPAPRPLGTGRGRHA